VEYLPNDRADRVSKYLRARISYQVWKRKLAQYLDSEPVRILDLGCGAGYLLSCLEDWYDTELVGGDVELNHVQFASERLSRSSLVQFDGQRLPFVASSFDLVFSLQVVEHVPDPDALLTEVARVLTDDGAFVVTTPNPQGLAARRLGEDWQGYKHDHVSLRSPRAWHESLNRAGLCVRSEGTTLFSSFPRLGRFPLALLSWIPLAVFGYFPWNGGESYKSIAQRC
jgi:SAM-dependent methyltransferase